jgi:hypothetical protein
MAKRGLNAQEYCDQLGRIIKRLGPKAYRHTGSIVLYSGPSRDIQRLLAPLFTRTNWNLSRDQVTRIGGVRLDETLVGRTLVERNLADYFSPVYARNPVDIDAAVLDVWAFVSREFVKADFRDAATAVCGADRTRTFRAHELKLAIYNAAAETINDVPIARIRAAYEAGGEYAAFRKICQAELALSRQWVRHARPGAEKAAAWDDYRARRKFFIVERQQMIRATMTRSRAVGSLAGIHASLSPARSGPPPARRTTGHPKAAGRHPH